MMAPIQKAKPNKPPRRKLKLKTVEIPQRGRRKMSMRFRRNVPWKKRGPFPFSSAYG